MCEEKASHTNSPSFKLLRGRLGLCIFMSVAPLPSFLCPDFSVRLRCDSLADPIALQNSLELRSDSAS